jgi:hypothetical protein
MTSTRASLLESAKQALGANDAILSLGAELASAEGVNARVAELQLSFAKEKFWENFWGDLAIGSCIASIVTLVLALYFSQAWLGVTGLALLLLFMWAGIKSSTWYDLLQYHRTQLGVLGPIAGTDRCLSALAFVEHAHPSVLAWRDLAVAERGQLYAFDVDIMGYLHAHEEACRTETVKQRHMEEACRKVHGIAPAQG